MKNEKSEKKGRGKIGEGGRRETKELGKKNNKGKYNVPIEPGCLFDFMHGNLLCLNK